MKPSKDDITFTKAALSIETCEKNISRLIIYRNIFFSFAGSSLGVISYDIIKPIIFDGSRPAPDGIMIFISAILFALGLHADVKIKMLLAFNFLERMKTTEPNQALAPSNDRIQN